MIMLGVNGRKKSLSLAKISFIVELPLLLSGPEDLDLGFCVLSPASRRVAVRNEGPRPRGQR